MSDVIQERRGDVLEILWSRPDAMNAPMSDIAPNKGLYRSTETMNLDDGLAYEAQTVYPMDHVEERLAGFLDRG